MPIKPAPIGDPVPVPIPVDAVFKPTEVTVAQKKLSTFERYLAKSLKADGFRDVIPASMHVTVDRRPGLVCEVCRYPIETSRLEFREVADPGRRHCVHLNRPLCRSLKNDPPPTAGNSAGKGSWYNRLERLYRSVTV